VAETAFLTGNVAVEWGLGLRWPAAYDGGAMKKPTFRLVAEAFTLVEVLVVAALVAILAALFLPVRHDIPTRAPIHECMNNLKQVGLALQMFADDNTNQFPPQVSVTNGGSLELILSNSPALHFQTLSNYLGRNWRAVHCPADESRQPLTTNGVLADLNVSYSLNVDATPRMMNIIHAGDRNLEVAGQAIRPGLFTLTTNVAVRWTRELHTKQEGKQCGNVLFTDGHVETLRENLSAAVQHQGLATNRLVFP
jgi:prepilin-type N-terminal cleavage/methylation domain-containing protein/prepilin-type processing-associated H-X9-DG protein